MRFGCICWKKRWGLVLALKKLSFITSLSLSSFSEGKKNRNQPQKYEWDSPQSQLANNLLELLSLWEHIFLQFPHFHSQCHCLSRFLLFISGCQVPVASAGLLASGIHFHLLSHSLFIYFLHSLSQRPPRVIIPTHTQHHIPLLRSKFHDMLINFL